MRHVARAVRYAAREAVRTLRQRVVQVQVGESIGSFFFWGGERRTRSAH